MYYTLSYKTKQFFFLLIKLSIITAVVVFVYIRLTSHSSLTVSNFIQFTLKNNIFAFKTLIPLLFLSVCNWGVAIFKWQFLVHPIVNITYTSAMSQSLGAFTAALFTPNRIGEYGAKALYFERPLRKKIMLANFINDMLQMSATLCFGCLGLLIFTLTYGLPFKHMSFIYYSFFSGIIFICFVVFLCKYSNFIMSWYVKLRNALLCFTTVRLFIGFMLSLCRYMVFSFQFYLLLVFFDTGLSYTNAMCIITTSYLLASLIPTLSIFDIVIKGGVAVFLFAFAGIDAFTVLTVTTLMWLFNTVIPCIFGCFYILTFRYPKLH